MVYDVSLLSLTIRSILYLGQLAAIRWRSKFGRPSKVPNVGDVDPTGSFCPVPEDWLMRKYGKLLSNILSKVNKPITNFPWSLRSTFKTQF